MNVHANTHTPRIAGSVLRCALTIACLSLPLTGYATTFYVGTCKPVTKIFPTIQDAVNAVNALPTSTTIPTIYICPGTYPEWITITQPLSLQGIQSGDSAGVTITVPNTAPNVVDGNHVAQVLVENPGGAVNISGITIDGTGISNNIDETGFFNSEVNYGNIFYDSASGTINHVITQNLLIQSKGFGIGIEVQDDFSVSPTVTIKNSSVIIPAQGVETTGISVPSGDITLNVTNTYLSLSGTGIGDYSTGIGTISNNTISAGSGIDSRVGTVSITGNTITASTSGYAVGDGNSTSTTITGNVLVGGTGIQTSDPNVTIKGNQFLPGSSSPGLIGVNFGCVSTPVAISGNTFLGTTTALSEVPAGTSLQGGAGTYAGVQTVEEVCLPVS